MSDIQSFRNSAELQLLEEYRQVITIFKFVVETERRFYLANEVDLQPRSNGSEIFYELDLKNAWVWDIYRSNRYVDRVHVITYHDVNVEQINA